MNAAQTMSATGVAIATERIPCAHCGTVCLDATIRVGTSHFCCHGCRTVFELLHENGLERFYDLEQKPGIRMGDRAFAGAFDYLDDPATRRQVVDFSDGKFSRVTLRTPAIHCLACVWLLENLFRLQPGVGRSQVNFPRKEVTIHFEDARLKLSGLAEMLASLGYEPELKLASLDKAGPGVGNRRLHLRIGVAGFAFGNVMLLCFPSYLGLPEDEKSLQPLFGWIAAALSTPVFLYSASDYWRAVWICLRRRILTVEFPIALGIAALYLQSLNTALRGGGPAFFDSFTGLLFFLLCGKLFQQKTYDVLTFDRDYRSYFPLSITRRTAEGDTSAPVMQLKVGDRIVVRNQELIPADAQLVSGPACIDYSFVTGESAPQPRNPGDYIYAGGRQIGGMIELEVSKEISQSYLTSLWNNEAFRKGDASAIDNLTNFAGRYFTYFVLVLAAIAGTYWGLVDPKQAVRVLSAVLIVACPCALALAAPFTLGSALRWLGRHKIYFKNTGVIETLSKIDTVVFDKTGTLTLPSQGGIEFNGDPLTPCDQGWIRSLSTLSTHPHSQGIATFLANEGRVRRDEVCAFREVAGAGIAGTLEGREIRLGSRRWLAEAGVEAPEGDANATEVHVAIGGVYRGRFLFRNIYRPGLAGVLERLRTRFRLALVSGDNDRERSRLAEFFGAAADLRFRQMPESKLAYIRSLQERGGKVIMIGDGLNDAGALKQSDVGVAVTEDVAAFSPACDAIWAADQFGRLPDVLRFSRLVMWVVFACFVVSFCYNAIGLTLAMSGRLSPLASAILMPTSTLSVIVLALLGTRWAAWRARLGGRSA